MDRLEAWEWVLDALRENLDQRLREKNPEVTASYLRCHKVTIELVEALKEGPGLRAAIEARDREIDRLHDLEAGQSYFLGARDCVVFLKWIFSPRTG